MNFSLTPEQQALRSAVRDFLTSECGSDVVRRLFASEDGFDPELWAKVARQGWTGLIIPERYGGVGLGWVECALVAEETGRALFPGPYLSCLLASAALLEGGTEEQKSAYLPRIAEGSLLATVALFEGRDPDLASIRMKARPSNGGYAIDGTKLFVTDGAVADLLVVAVEESDGLGFLAVEADRPGISREELPVVDRTRRQAAITFREVEVPSSAGLSAGPAGLVERVRDRAVLFAAGELTGVARRCLEMSAEHAKTRQQFGRAIGVYQAVSHKIADMFLAAEHATSLLYYAAWAADHDPGAASVAAWEAKGWASQAASRAAADGIQVHGGMGFTWEHDLHLYFKRAKANEVLFSDIRHLRDLISRHRHASPA